MTTKTSLRQLVATERPLLTPLAHDALTARLIERAGFRSVGIGGSALLASRYGLPDIGLAALGEMVDGVRDIVAATGLPVMVDGDDGYGDVKSVAHMCKSYVRLGVSGIVLEDQVRVAKQPGDAGAIGVSTADEMIKKVKVAVSACAGTDIQIIARCDAYKLEGLAAAMRRGEKYLAAGAHALFFPGVPTPEELAEIGNKFRGAHLMTAMFEGRKTWLPPSQLYDMGYRQIALPGLLMQRVVHCIDQTLQDLKQFAATGRNLPSYPAEQAQNAFEQALKFDKWRAIGADG